ncbi:MAG: hypothetical protein ACYC63_03215 [Armatimonadota bacterium]
MPTPCRTCQMLKEPGTPKLLVSLPANDLDLAKAAVDGGAQGLKVHLNIVHAAAGLHFGSLDEEAATIEAIVGLGLPVGVVPGDQQAMISPEELPRLAAMGVDFCDVYLGAMPAWMLNAPPLGIMVALGAADIVLPERLASVNRLPSVHMVEASVIAHDGYGAALSAADLCDYTAVVSALRVELPVIVPTQRRILPEDLPALAATGISGLLIGAIVTGTDAESIRQATARYAAALQSL